MIRLKELDFELLNVDWKNIISINTDSKEESELEMKTSVLCLSKKKS